MILLETLLLIVLGAIIGFLFKITISLFIIGGHILFDTDVWKTKQQELFAKTKPKPVTYKIDKDNNIKFD